MPTYILSEYTVGESLQNLVVSADVYKRGVKRKLVAEFENVRPATLTPGNCIAISGTYEDAGKSLTGRISGAKIIDIPRGNDWLGVLIGYFLDNNVPAVEIRDYPGGGHFVDALLRDIYLTCELAADKLTINKLEFGRYLPLNEPGDTSRETNWVKGVFTNKPEHYLTFLQTSWDGEEGDKYMLAYTEENKKKLLRFLEVPFHRGWTETDYRLDDDKFYKVDAAVAIDAEPRTWSIVLKDIGEQDIPMGTDILDQWFRVRWADSFMNKKRRNLDVTVVAPVCCW